MEEAAGSAITKSNDPHLAGGEKQHMLSGQPSTSGIHPTQALDTAPPVHVIHPWIAFDLARRSATTGHPRTVREQDGFFFNGKHGNPKE